MSILNTIKSAAIGIAALLVMGGAGSAFAAELYSLPTEEGLELFLLENHIQTPTLEAYRNAGSSLTLGQGGVLTFAQRDSLAEHFGLTGSGRPSEQSLTYQGFRTSPLGRVLNVEGRFQPTLDPARVETADSKQAVERHFDFGKPVSERAGWENGQGMKILSF
jgi:hypothetical protein